MGSGLFMPGPKGKNYCNYFLFFGRNNKYPKILQNTRLISFKIFDLKLLIIEDEKSLLKSIVDYFSREDFLCETACSFAEGLQKIEGFVFDCIILDIGLPGGSGLKILSYLREEKKEDGVVIISAKNSLEDKIIGLDLGADDYLTKPFHLAELSARVKALIRRKYSNGANQLEYGGIRVDLISKIVS